MVVHRLFYRIWLEAVLRENGLAMVEERRLPSAFKPKHTLAVEIRETQSTPARQTMSGAQGHDHGLAFQRSHIQARCLCRKRNKSTVQSIGPQASHQPRR